MLGVTCGFAACAKCKPFGSGGLVSRQSYPEAGTLTRPSAPETACVRARTARMHRTGRFAWSAVTALLMAEVLGACGGGPEQTQVEREVQAYLQSVVAPAAIADISCPPDAPVRPGSTFLCDGKVEGAFYEAQVTIIDEQGRREVRPRQAVMQVNATETALGAEAATALGFSVQADCGDDQYLVVSVGHTFLCTLERTDTGATQDIQVEVQNEIGAIEWRLKG